MSDDTIRVLRVLEYIGPRSVLENQLQQRVINGALMIEPGEMSGLLSPEYQAQLRSETWRRNNPIQGCAPPPRKSQLLSIKILCPIYGVRMNIKTPLMIDNGAFGTAWEFVCPRCNFIHSVYLGEAPPTDASE